MTDEEKLETLNNWVQYLYGKVLSLDKRVKELEAQVNEDDCSSNNLLGLTVPLALEFLDRTMEDGSLGQMVDKFRQHKKDYRGTSFKDVERVYQDIKGRLECTVALKKGDRVGQEWLDYWVERMFSSKSLPYSIGAYFVSAYSMNRRKE